jgi:transposase-like protein
MPKPVISKSKRQSLKEQGTLNPHPEEVVDPLFVEGEFFDAYDLMQVKYEMLRRAEKEGNSVSEAASAFGFSRPAFYQTRKCFSEGGLAGLLPRVRGPKEAHKLTKEVMVFIDRVILQDSSLRSPALAVMVKKQFGISVHPRSIERALGRRQKKPQK